jgi:hypothetical protein
VIELCDYRNAGPVSAPQSRLQEPGAGMVSFMVRDLEDTLKAVRDAKLPIVTTEGQPVTVAKLQRIVIKDPDGTFVELIQE